MIRFSPVFGSAVLLILFGPVGIDIYLPALIDLEQQLSATNQSVQLSLSLYVFALGIGQLVVGPIADKIGRRPIALVGLAFFSLTSLAITQIESIESLLWLRLLQGLSASCTAVVAITLIRDRYSPQEGAKRYGYLNGLLCLAPAIAPVLGGFLTELYGWRSNFMFLTCFAAAALAFVGAVLPETRPSHTNVRIRALLTTYGRILKHPVFAIYAICCAGALAVALNFAVLSPAVLMSQLGVSVIEFSLLFGLNALVVMAGSFVSPKVMDRYARQGCIMIGSLAMLIGGISLAVIALFDTVSVVMFMWPNLIASFGFSLVLGAAASLALEHFEDCAGTASSLQGCIQFLGASATSIMITYLGYQLVGSLALLIMIVGAYGIATRWLSPAI